MPTQQKSPIAKQVRRGKPTPDAKERIALLANEYIVGHYAIGFLGGAPLRLHVDQSELWVVPIMLTSPGYGAVGQTGLVAIEAATSKVVASTPRQEVVAAGRRLREARRHELEAAFHRARTV